MNNEIKEALKQIVSQYVKLKGAPCSENYDALDRSMLSLYDLLILNMEDIERGEFSLEILHNLLPEAELERLQEIAAEDFTRLTEEREPKKEEVS